MKSTIRSAMMAVVLLSLCIMTTGCWNRIELNELAITSATGVDWDGHNWVMSYQVLIPSAISAGIGTSGSGTPQSPVIVYSTKGKSIREAMMHSFSESPRKLFYAHNRVVIISEEVARRGFNELLDVYFRNSGPRETVSMLVTPGTARRVLEQFMQLQIIPGEGMKDIILSEARNSSILPNIPVYQMGMNLTGDAKSGVLPEIYISGKEDTSTLDSFTHTTIPSKLKLGRLAIMHNDRMIGWMNRRQSLGVSFLRGEVKQTTIVTPCTDEQGHRGFDTFVIQHSSTRLKPKLTGGKLSYTAKVDASGVLTESDCAQNLYKPDITKKMESKVAQQIQQILKGAWKQGQQMGADVFGAAEKAHRKYPKAWKQWSKDWNSVFAETPLEVQAQFRITRMGLSNKSFQYLTEKDKKG
ncbi:Ger(x)C family spore germination protein [Paenibacillus sp. PR3]|uniref:Ger(X)C family spore germination protein n=1 Tax=Paenibacillus terricola TaxID=2763503 RepID=A0ABR8N031_9BACL|nr:Ger(x)C family spore germination protein [Paenibacillus terricola]MBD3920866.1 Ger(x)C family spore germination protein [Paenibacillus terricola]